MTPTLVFEHFVEFFYPTVGLLDRVLVPPLYFIFCWLNENLRVTLVLLLQLFLETLCSSHKLCFIFHQIFYLLFHVVDLWFVVFLLLSLYVLQRLYIILEVPLDFLWDFIALTWSNTIFYLDGIKKVVRAKVLGQQGPNLFSPTFLRFHFGLYVKSPLLLVLITQVCLDQAQLLYQFFSIQVLKFNTTFI